MEEAPSIGAQEYRSHFSIDSYCFSVLLRDGEFWMMRAMRRQAVVDAGVPDWDGPVGLAGGFSMRNDTGLS